MAIERGFVTNSRVAVQPAIEMAGSIGLDYVEIMMHGTGHRTRLAPAAAEIRETLDDHGLSCVVHLPFSGIDLGSPHEHVQRGAVEELRASVRAAAQIGARKGVIHPRSRARDEADRARLMGDGLQEVVEIASECDLEICAENMFGGYATVHDTEDILARTDASLTYDTGHGRIEGLEGEKAAAFLERHREHISHVHLNDTVGKSDDHLPFGAGTLDFETVLAPLIEGPWNGTFSLEVGTQNLDYIEHSTEHLDALLAR